MGTGGDNVLLDDSIQYISNVAAQYELNKMAYFWIQQLILDLIATKGILFILYDFFFFVP